MGILAVHYSSFICYYSIPFCGVFTLAEFETENITMDDIEVGGNWVQNTL